MLFAARFKLPNLCRMSIRLIFVFQMTLLHNVQSVFVCSIFLTCRMPTKCVCVFHVNLLQDSTDCVCVFHMTLLQVVHEVCLCIPYDSPAGCPRSVFMYSVWLPRRLSTKCVYVFHMTLLQDVHEVGLCVPLDFPAWYPQSLFMCSTWLSCRMSMKCVCVFHMTLLQNVGKEYFVFCITLITYSHHFRMQNSPNVFVKGNIFCFSCKVPYGCLYVKYIYSKLENVR